jgi:hypothetical protein
LNFLPLQLSLHNSQLTTHTKFTQNSHRKQNTTQKPVPVWVNIILFTLVLSAVYTEMCVGHTENVFRTQNLCEFTHKMSCSNSNSRLQPWSYICSYICYWRTVWWFSYHFNSSFQNMMMITYFIWINYWWYYICNTYYVSYFPDKRGTVYYKILIWKFGINTLTWLSRRLVNVSGVWMAFHWHSFWMM